MMEYQSILSGLFVTTIVVFLYGKFIIFGFASLLKMWIKHFDELSFPVCAACGSITVMIAKWRRKEAGCQQSRGFFHIAPRKK